MFCNHAHMKMRKNLSLDAKAVARGEQTARRRKLSLSALIESQLFGLPAEEDDDEYWPGPPLKPITRPGDPRYEYLRRKHA